MDINQTAKDQASFSDKSSENKHLGDTSSKKNNDGDSSTPSFLDLFQYSLDNPSPLPLSSITNSYVDDGFTAPNLPYENIGLIFEDHKESIKLIDRIEVNGRPLPHALILDAFDISLDDNAIDSPALHSASSDLSMYDSLNAAIKSIANHYSYYDSMFSRDVFEDTSSFPHLQSALLVQSYSMPLPHLYTPIMGINALNIALLRISTDRDNDIEVGNIFVPAKLKDDEDAAFSYEYIGHAAFIERQHYMDGIYLSDHEEDEDIYAETAGAIGVVIGMNCLNKDTYPDFKSTLSEHPFLSIGSGYQGLPPIWLSLVYSHYSEDDKFSRAYAACSEYEDVFLFWLAASSGLPLIAFQSFNSQVSDFHELSDELKIKALIDMMPMVESIALKMQSSNFLQQTPLTHLYES